MFSTFAFLLFNFFWCLDTTHISILRSVTTQRLFASHWSLVTCHLSLLFGHRPRRMTARKIDILFLYARFRWEFAHSRSIDRLNYFPCPTQKLENILVVNQDAILKDWQLLCSRELFELRVFHIARVMYQTIQQQE